MVTGLTNAGRPVRLLHRQMGDRPGGLGGAVQEGFKLARGTVLVVMDADLQHPPEVVPALVAPVLSGEAALVAGNRYGWAGGTPAWRDPDASWCLGFVARWSIWSCRSAGPWRTP